MNRKFYNTDAAAAFSRQWWVHVARTGLLVALLSVLIWVYADLEFTETKDMQTTLRLTVGRGKGVTILSQTDVPVTFRVRGNRSTLEKYQDELTAAGQLAYELPESYAPGANEMRVGDVLNASSGIVRNGLQVVSASPWSTKVVVDSLKTVELPVEFDYTGATFADKPNITPAVVTVRVAQSEWAKLNSNADVTIKTRRVDLTNTPTDKPITMPLELVPRIGQTPVECEPRTVQVELRISQRTEQKTLQVAVQVLTPPGWLNEAGALREFSLRGKDDSAEWVKQITVTGAKKDIDRLTPKDVQAFIVLTEDDKKPQETFLPRKAIIRFPADAQVKLVGEEPVVNFRLEKRP